MYRMKPFYLLFADSDYDQKSESGIWRFHLQAIEGQDCVAEQGREDCIDRERLQLLSVIRGLEALDQPSIVNVLTPSRHVARGMRFGLPAWRETAFCWERFGEMIPINHADLWRRIDRTLEFHKVRCRQWQPAVSPENRSAALPLTSKHGQSAMDQLAASRLGQPPTPNRSEAASRLLAQHRNRLGKWLANTRKVAFEWAIRISGLEFEEPDTIHGHGVS